MHARAFGPQVCVLFKDVLVWCQLRVSQMPNCNLLSIRLCVAVRCLLDFLQHGVYFGFR